MFKVGDKVVHKDSVGFNVTPIVMEILSIDADGIFHFKEGSYVKWYQAGFLSLKDWIVESIKYQSDEIERLKKELLEKDQKLETERGKLNLFMQMLAEQGEQ
jgi:hypothetical protein